MARNDSCKSQTRALSNGLLLERVREGGLKAYYSSGQGKRERKGEGEREGGGGRWFKVRSRRGGEVGGGWERRERTGGEAPIE